MTINAIIFISLGTILSVISFILDRQKTLAGFKKGWAMFRKLLVPISVILIIVSVVLYVIPPGTISAYLGANSGPAGFLIAAIAGSLVLIPPFIAYPIAASLLQQGASYAIVATFITTLIMVGVMTLPLEIRFFGRRAAITRNVLNFFAALIIGLAVGIIL